MPKTKKAEWARPLIEFTGARIRRARESLEMTQTEFLARAGLGHHVNWLSDVEHGKHSIDPHELKRIADSAGFPVDWFLDTEYDRRPMTAPMTRIEWERLYADPERAEIHWQIDQLLRRVLDRATG